MSWLKKLMPSGIRTESGAAKRRSVPEGLWEKCERCGAVLYRPELEENLEVCPKCNHHMPIRARSRVPVVAGFGIKDAASAAAMAREADGVVVGSALVAELAPTTDAQAAAQAARRFLTPLRQALDG